MKKIIYSKYSNERSEQFNIRTDIVIDEEQVKFVQKRPQSILGERHIKNIYQAYLKLTKIYQDSKFEINRCKNIEGGIEFEYLEGIPFDEHLDRYLESKEYDILLQELKEYVEVVRRYNSPEKFQRSEDFITVFGDVMLPEGLAGNSVMNIDMVTNNAIINNNAWHMIDYEWTFFFLIPVNFVIFRIVNYYLCGNSKRQLLLAMNIYEYIGLTDYEVEQYKIMEENFQKYILGEVVPVRHMHSLIGQNTLSLSDFLGKEAKEEIRNRIEVFFDCGEGFSPENIVYFSPESNFDSLKSIEISVPKNVKQIRIDPANDSCLLSIKSLKALVNKEEIHLSYLSNGFQVDEKRIVFSDTDPQILICDYNKDMHNILFTFSIELITVSAAEEIRAGIEGYQSELTKMQDSISKLSIEVEEGKQKISWMEGTKIWRLYTKYKRLKKKIKNSSDNATIWNRETLSAEQERIEENPGKEQEEEINEEVLYNLDMPINNSSHNYGVIDVGGWIIAPLSQKIRVTVNIHNKEYQATTGLKRNDVRQSLEDHNISLEKALYSGFYFEYKIPDEYLEMDHLVKVTMETSYHTIIEERIVKNYPKEDIYLLKGEINNRFKPYEIWTLKHQLNSKVFQLMEKNIQNFKYKPFISIVMPVFNPDPDIFRQAIDSVIDQIYDKWELCIVDDCSSNINVDEIVRQYIKDGYPVKSKRLGMNSNISMATNEGVSMAWGDFIFLMDHDDLITSDALYEVVRVCNEYEDVDVIYSDDDKISMEGKTFAPQFKPDFSPELLLSYMYISHIFVVRKDLYDKVGGCRTGYEGSQDFDLALRVTEEAKRIIHIPKILYHWRATPASTASSGGAKPESIGRGLKAVQEAVDRRGIPAKAYIPEFARAAEVGIFALKYTGLLAPKVSIIIPTKNHVDILKRCIDSILEKTTYAHYEIILVDNDSDDNETLNYLASLNFRIIKIKNDNSGFNFSKMVNAGVQNAQGEYIILLNNDTQVIAPDWIENLLVFMQIQSVGVVGAKLLYEDNLVQHGGVLLGVGNGVAAHGFKLLPDQHGGYMSFAKVARNYSAVTAAAFMTKKEIYEKVVGFDEENFSVSYNDVDFCMKVQKEGYRIVYSPNVLLYHHEGKSRGVEQTGHYSDPKEEYNFVSRWLEPIGFKDPYYNENLSKENEKFEVELSNIAVTEHFPIKILLITNSLNLEGAPIVQLHVAKYLLSKGYSFGVISPSDGPLKEEYEKENIPVMIYTDCYDTSDNYEGIIQSAAKNIINDKYDLIFANTLDSFWGIDLGEKINIPSVLGIHESASIDVYFQNKDSIVIKRAGECIKKATKVVFVADATAKIFGAFDTYNTTIIRNGIDFSKVEYYKENYNINTIRKECNIEEDAIIVSIFGTLCLRKGQEVFVEAAKQIKDLSRQKIVFLIIGSNKTIYGENIISKIKEYGMEADFRILDARSDIYKYYLISDVYVCASYEESSPLVTLEAMAFESAIVSTNVFGIPEQVRDGREALLCEPGDAGKMASLILKIINDKELSRHLSYNAYYRVKTHFTIERMMSKYDYIFQSSLIEGRNRIYQQLRPKDVRNEK